MSQKSQSAQNVQSLFQAAQEEGLLSGKSIMAINIPDIGTKIQAALGTPAVDVQSSEVFLVGLLVDDSGSILHAGNEPVVREGANIVHDALGASKQKDSIMALTAYLNGTQLHPWVALSDAPKLDSSNYKANGGTPLYDETVAMLAKVMAKSMEFRNLGVPVRTATLIVTDGHDEHSRKHTAATVATVVKDMLMQEDHIIAAMGIEDGSTDFSQVFTDMGIKPQWILTPANSPGEIRKAFEVFSKSAVRASQGAVHFSQTAMGGFTG